MRVSGEGARAGMLAVASMVVGLTVAGLTVLGPSAARAQAAIDPPAKAIDEAGKAAATEGGPGTVVPETADVAKAPGVQSPIERPAGPAVPPEGTAPAGR